MESGHALEARIFPRHHRPMASHGDHCRELGKHFRARMEHSLPLVNPSGAWQEFFSVRMHRKPAS
jgi:hypothetical protein